MNLIYPPICGICGKPNQKFLCIKCKNILQNDAKFKIEKNKNSNYYFDEHLYIFNYEGKIRKIILDFKFNERPYMYKTIVNFILKNKKFFSILQSYDTIIPVPISTKRRKERGYNQSELIAKEIAKIVRTEYNKKSLIKTKNIIEQSKLNKEQREKNVKGVYELKNKRSLKNKKILLVDDIYTTGSTANECCKVLSQSEPDKIGIFTIAKD